MSEHLDTYPLRSLKYSRFRSKSLKFLLSWGSRDELFRGSRKRRSGRKMEFQKQVLFVVPHSMSMKAWKNIYVFWTFFCQRQQLCSFLRGLRLYVRSWTIISICSVTLDRVKSKWLSSLKSARKLRSNIDAALVFSHQNSIF